MSLKSVLLQEGLNTAEAVDIGTNKQQQYGGVLGCLNTAEAVDIGTNRYRKDQSFR